MSSFLRRFQRTSEAPTPPPTSKTNPLMFLDEVEGAGTGPSAPPTPDSKSAPFSPKLGARPVVASMPLPVLTGDGDGNDFLPGTPVMSGGVPAKRPVARSFTPSNLSSTSNSSNSSSVDNGVSTVVLDPLSGPTGFDAPGGSYGNGASIQTPKRSVTPTGPASGVTCGERFFMQAALQLRDHKERQTAGVVDVVPVLHTMLASTCSRRCIVGTSDCVWRGTWRRRVACSLACRYSFYGWIRDAPSW